MFFNFKKRSAILLVLVSFLASCATSTYYGPGGFVDYDSTGTIKKSEQSVSRAGEKMSTFDEEYVYDAKGNVLKFKLTEYISGTSPVKKFIVWETEYLPIGGFLVPLSVSCNGVPYVQVEYEILSSKHTGPVIQETKDRRYYEVLTSFLNAPQSMDWSISLAAYGVSFKADDKFVKTVTKYDFYSGEYSKNYLTLGYDNIVIKKFVSSREKLMEGMLKSNIPYFSSTIASSFKNEVSEFNYTWKVIGDKICQTGLDFKAQYTPFTTFFNAEQKYDSAGNRTEETWTVTDPSKKESKKIEIFKQVLTY